MSDKHRDTIEMLQRSYAMELETVINYLAYSINLDGVRAQQIKSSLGDDIAEEIQHAEQLGRRIKQLGGLLPGSATLAISSQTQPPLLTTQVVDVIKGVIAAEEAACEQYQRTIAATHRRDPVTADLCTRLLAEEEEHLVLFRGFLKEYENNGNDEREKTGKEANRPSVALLDDTDAFIPTMLGLS